MTDASSPASTQNTRFIQAPPKFVYRAFTDPAALAIWFAPGEMTAKVHAFDYRVGGGYQMSLYYPAAKPPSGKTGTPPDL